MSLSILCLHFFVSHHFARIGVSKIFLEISFYSYQTLLYNIVWSFSQKWVKIINCHYKVVTHAKKVSMERKQTNTSGAKSNLETNTYTFQSNIAYSNFSAQFYSLFYKKLLLQGCYLWMILGTLK